MLLHSGFLKNFSKSFPEETYFSFSIPLFICFVKFYFRPHPLFRLFILFRTSHAEFPQFVSPKNGCPEIVTLYQISACIQKIRLRRRRASFEPSVHERFAVWMLGSNLELDAVWLAAMVIHWLNRSALNGGPLICHQLQDVRIRRHLRILTNLCPTCFDHSACIISVVSSKIFVSRF